MTESPTIESLGVSAYRIPTEVPEADGTLSWDQTTVVVVEPRLSDGTVGLGYAYGTAAMVPLIQDVLAPAVLSTMVHRNADCWEAMVRAIRNLGRPGLCSMAIAAVDIALWDARARAAGQPLSLLLGQVRDSVPVYGSGGFTTYSDDLLVEQMRGFVEAGIPRVKMKIGKDRGADPKEDLRRVRLVRQKIGDAAELFVDANGAYDRTTAWEVGRWLHEQAGVSWFEEPVSSDDREGLAFLRSVLPLDVTAGEYGYDLSYFATMLESRAVDVLQADVSRCAGITEWLRVAALARAHQTPLSAHCAPGLHVAPASCADNLRHIEYFHDHTRIDQLLFEGTPAAERGALPVGREPGMGLQLKPGPAAAHRVA